MSRMPMAARALLVLLAAAAPAAPAAAADTTYRLVSARADLVLSAARASDGYAGTAEAHVRSRKGFTGTLTPARRSRVRAAPIRFSGSTRATKTEPDGSVRSCQGPVAGRMDALRLTARPAGRRVQVEWGLGAPLELCPGDRDVAFPLLLFPPEGFNVVMYRRSMFRGPEVTLPIHLRTAWTNPSNALTVTLVWHGEVVLRKVIARADRGGRAPRRP
jgi:hypothetical protein